jgi:hypothetical protein
VILDGPFGLEMCMLMQEYLYAILCLGLFV